MDFIHPDGGKELVIDGDKFAEMKPGSIWIVKEHVIWVRLFLNGYKRLQ
jgi:hypothetical protein